MKIFAMFIIVLSHIVQSLSMSEQAKDFIFKDILIDLSQATVEPARLLLSSLRYCGGLGNDIFFLCSAWFLLDKKATSKRKIIYMMSDVWIISICVLILSLLFCREIMGAKTIISCFFPVLFGNNWYVTCYILFCLVHPFLNLIIKNMDQKSMLKTVVFMAVFYIGLNYIKSSFLYGSKLIVWIAIYFVTAYVKIYMKDIFDRKKINFTMLFIGIAGNISMILMTNFLGMKISFFSDRLLYWHKSSSPFLILTAFALLNFARNMDLKSIFINRISKMTLLIYLIHENIFLCCYLRPMMWNKVFEKFGNSHMVSWAFMLTVIIFIASIIVGFIYLETLQKVVRRISDRIYSLLVRIYAQMENIILKIH